MENIEPSRTLPPPNSAESDRGRRLFLFFSLSLNLALLLFFALAWRSAAQRISPQPDNSIQSNRRILKAYSKHVAHPASAWSQLESTDLAVYAVNLRAAGCPPKTVRDILLPLLEERFDLAKQPMVEPVNFWASFSQRQAAATARAEQESVLEKENEKALKELFGFAWNSEGLTQACTGAAAGALGFLDYDGAEKLLCIAEKFKKQFSRANSSHRLDRRSAIYQTLRQETGEVLSPDELEETELRGILAICEYRDPNLCKVGLTGSELRQLMAFRRELCNPLSSALLAEGNELLSEPDWACEHQFNAKVRSLLGESRFLVYLKSCDAGIEKSLITLEKEHLPQSLALQLFDLREEAIARARAIRQLPVRRAEKRSRLAALRQNAVEQLASLPSAATDDLLIRINEDWLQEIANP